jgi:hypothetical protein
MTELSGNFAKMFLTRVSASMTCFSIPCLIIEYLIPFGNMPVLGLSFKEANNNCSCLNPFLFDLVVEKMKLIL